MKQSPRFISTFKLGQYDVVNTLSGATPTADVKLEPVITNVSGTGLSRTVTTQITNTGSSDAHNVWVKIEVFSQGSRVKLDGQDYLRVNIGTVKLRQHNKISYFKRQRFWNDVCLQWKHIGSNSDCAEYRRATLNGRALVQTGAVTLNANTIIKPTP